MSDALSKETANAFIKSGDLGKILIFTLIIFTLVLTAVMWILQTNNKNQLAEFTKQGTYIQTMSENITHMLANQSNVESLRKDIFESYSLADKDFDNVITTLGVALRESNVQFPQDLNIALKDFRTSFKGLVSKLIKIN